MGRGAYKIGAIQVSKAARQISWVSKIPLCRNSPLAQDQPTRTRADGAGIANGFGDLDPSRRQGGYSKCFGPNFPRRRLNISHANREPRRQPGCPFVKWSVGLPAAGSAMELALARLNTSNTINQGNRAVCQPRPLGPEISKRPPQSRTQMSKQCRLTRPLLDI